MAKSVHCRRRKIRCVPDNQGRCSNCIRLKKECNFYPVETTEKRPRSLSKPDFSTNEASSSPSSPSPPGLALGKIPRVKVPSVYAASVPVTPTHDYHQGVLEDCGRHNSISSVASGGFSASHSAAASRRPSLAHVIASLKTDKEYLATHGIDSPNFSRIPGVRMNPVSEISSNQTDQRGLDSAFWRLASSPMSTGQYSIYSQQVNIGSMSSLPSTTPIDTPQESVWPSRMNSIDHNLIPGLYTTYPDAEYSHGLPELYNTSSSASTTSLTTSIPEVSQFSGTRPSNQFFVSPWIEDLPVGTDFGGNGVVKKESYDGNVVVKSELYDGYHLFDTNYQEVTDPNSTIFHSPLQSPKFISQI